MFRATLLFITLLITMTTTASDKVTQHDEILDLNVAHLGGDFTLQSSQGPFSLEQLRGKAVLLYFGYTKCPDVCPTSLAVLSQVLNELSADELKSVQAVFISVDPKRDNFEVLDNYVSYFHPDLMGVTGSSSEIEKVAKLYGVQYEEVALEGSAFGYAVNHSAVTYLIDPEGKLLFTFPHKTPSYMILEAIKFILGGH